MNKSILLVILLTIMPLPTKASFYTEIECNEWFRNVSLENITSLNVLSNTQKCASSLSENGKSALYIATENDNAAMISWLIKQGASLTLRSSYDKINYTPFLMAGAKGKNQALIELLKYKVNFEETNYYGGTALIPASEKGYLETVEILLNDGRIDVNHVNKIGWTALLEVTILGADTIKYQKIIKMLLSHGADLNIKDFSGVTAISHAKKRGLTKILLILENHNSAPVLNSHT